MGNRHFPKRRSNSETTFRKGRRGRGLLEHALAGLVALAIAGTVGDWMESHFPATASLDIRIWLFIGLMLAWVFLPDWRRIGSLLAWLGRAGWATLRLFVFRSRPTSKTSLPIGYYQMLDLTPQEFEQETAALLMKLGFLQAHVTGGKNDKGVDVAGTDDLGRYVLVQCKKYGPGHPVGSKDVQALTGSLRWEKDPSSGVHPAYGLFFTMGEYTADALTVARERNVLPIDRYGIAELLQAADSGRPHSDVNGLLKLCAAWNDRQPLPQYLP